MRLSSEQRAVIRETANFVFGQDAEVRLFGSRVDDARRGGDIDLLVRLASVEPQRRRKALRLVALLQQRLGDQPIDVVVVDPSTGQDAFLRQAQKTAIPL